MRNLFRCGLGITMALMIGMPFLLTGCGQTKADVAAHNLSREAEQFKVARRIVFINGITDKYLAEVQGFCSVETANSALGGSLEVTCDVGKNKQNQEVYKKDFFGLSDNVTYTVEQIDPINVSVTRYKVIFRPSTILPEISSH